MNRFASSLVALFAILASADAFAPSTRAFGVASRSVAPVSEAVFQPAALQRQRKSVAQVQTMGLFGLGPAEIGIIFVAAAFLLGPDKLASFGKDAGKIAGELKEVPKEFQKGLEEGEATAKAMKLKEAKDAEKIVEKTVEKVEEKAAE
jgi:sec-independent protein translocase protein TatA